ncbi:glycoside hydrolase family 108 protein [Devosia sp. 2618]|uniref:glycoside hydrolase family 108 protein n=1 Tax=Devosia sp. 2618 TaxID=3156454 RepID=UPI003397276D
MAKTNFAQALGEVLKHEGGWADHPKDPGGATMKGVTLATYRRYRPGATKAQLRAITDAELQRIYREGYWDAVRGDDLPAGLDLAVFDFAVNSGPGRAAIYLQNIIGVAPDGKIGPITLKAVEKHSVASLINELCSHRLAFLERLSTWPTFGKGWSRRVADVRAKSLSMASAMPPLIPGSPSLPEPAKGKSPPWGIIIAVLVIAAILGGFFVRF